LPAVCAALLGACSTTAAETQTTLVASTPTTAAVVTTEPAIDVEALQAALDAWSAESGAGVSAAVDRGDGAKWAGVAGVADGTTGRALAPDDTFRIGSITKTFTAVVVLQLVEEGVLGLEQPVAEVLPDLGLDPAITVRHVLGHQTGLRDGLEGAALGTDPVEARTIVEISVAAGQLFEPGTHFDYCNANYLLAALLIEAATGFPADVAVRDRIIDPLGMDATFMAGRDDRPVTAPPDGDPDLEVGFGARDHVNYTAGAMASTPAELAAFAQALFRGGLLEPATVAAMVTPGGPVGDGAEYGLGVEVISLGGHAGWGHRGGVRGYLSAVFLYPQDGTAVAVATNSWAAGDFWELLETLSDIALRAG
jgi:D-alanyl-D-alanine carboxypeptidase